MTTPIVVALNWSPLFKLMCDASGIALIAILGKYKDKLFYIVYCVRKSLKES